MRLPGFLHRKGEPFLSRIISTHDGLPTTLPTSSMTSPTLRMARCATPSRTTSGEQEPDAEAKRRGAGKLVCVGAGDISQVNGHIRRDIPHIVADLGRDLEEDLSISPSGVKDFGVHDLDDPRQGKRTPVDLVMECKSGCRSKTSHGARSGTYLSRRVTGCASGCRRMTNRSKRS